MNVKIKEQLELLLELTSRGPLRYFLHAMVVNSEKQMRN